MNTTNIKAHLFFSLYRNATSSIFGSFKPGAPSTNQQSSGPTTKEHHHLKLHYNNQTSLWAVGLDCSFFFFDYPQSFTFIEFNLVFAFSL